MYSSPFSDLEPQSVSGFVRSNEILFPVTRMWLLQNQNLAMYFSCAQMRPKRSEETRRMLSLPQANFSIPGQPLACEVSFLYLDRIRDILAYIEWSLNDEMLFPFTKSFVILWFSSSMKVSVTTWEILSKNSAVLTSNSKLFGILWTSLILGESAEHGINLDSELTAYVFKYFQSEFRLFVTGSVHNRKCNFAPIMSLTVFCHV